MNSNVVKKGGNDDDRTTDDLISRQQAIVAIEQHETAILEGHKWYEGIEYGYAAAHRHLVDIIEQLPSTQPERLRGEWTKDSACQFCGFKPWYERDIHTLSFCPNCGADMRGETE